MASSKREGSRRAAWTGRWDPAGTPGIVIHPSSTSGTSKVPQPRQSQTRRNGPRGPSSRSKRAAILDVATELFGREGYEHSKWADVAAAVGIGSTALYHYFESKLHCLYEIMAEALEADREKFERITAEHDD